MIAHVEDQWQLRRGSCCIGFINGRPQYAMGYYATDGHAILPLHVDTEDEAIKEMKRMFGDRARVPAIQDYGVTLNSSPY